MKHFYLIGYMGCGKSSVAREMASLTGFTAVELDDIIETRMGKTITEIFDEGGEEAFRDAETALLKEITFDPTVGSRTTEEYKEAMGIEDAGPSIVSCGGGLPLRQENVDIMKENGVVIWLSAEPETIASRLEGSDNRPLLPEGGNIEAIANMLAKRTPYYESAADYHVSTDGKTVSQIAAEIINLLLEKTDKEAESNSDSVDASLADSDIDALSRAFGASDDIDNLEEEEIMDYYDEDSDDSDALDSVESDD